jgi:predicted nucleic acid-binding Zn ribbon protein
MNYCPNCGKELEPGHVFCPNCGQKPLQQNPKKVQNNKHHGRYWVTISVLIIVLVIAIAAVVSGLVIGLGGNNSSSSNYYQPTYPTYTYQPPTTTYTYQTPTPSYTPTTRTLLSNQTVTSSYHNYNSYVIQAGKTVSLSWSADGSVSVYILTENQYDYFSFWGYHLSPAAYKSGSSGTIVYNVANTDTYYLVIKNPSLFQNVKVYSATASW